jgi:predicted DsbA family dithiol-disulfide isomerase
MLVLHYDVTSLPATVAALRLQRIADEGGVVGFQGIDPIGVDAALPVTLDQLEEIARWSQRAEQLGLRVRRPSQRPPTLSAHLVGVIAAAVGLGAAWRDALFRAYWIDDAALGDHDVLLELSRDVGLDTGEVADRLGDPTARVALRQRMTADRNRGIGGVPVLELDGTFVSAELSDADLRQLAGL